MRPPPIRYPLPTLLALVLGGLVAWKGMAWTRPLRADLVQRWERWREGPPPPASTMPKVLAGPIVRRVLLLQDNTAWSARPGGPAAGTIRLRQWADLYDIWPIAGPPTHYRIGNRQPIGWVSADDVLPWDTRLVVRPEESSLPLAETTEGPARPVQVATGVPLPVLDWDGSKLRVAAWDADRPWEAVASVGWIDRAQLADDAAGVLVSVDELESLLTRRDGANHRRLRAILGRLADPTPISPAGAEAARAVLPGWAFAGGADEGRLGELFRDWRPDVAWGGFSFRAVPLSALP